MTNPATTSLWNATAHRSTPRTGGLVGGGRHDAVVVGAGIVGLTAALALAREGRRVLVLEARRVGSGVTGSTTGKVTAAHGLRYSLLQRDIGRERTRMYADANQRAVGWIRDLVQTEEIACDWRDRPAFTYTSDPSQQAQLEDEARATIDAGLPAHEVRAVPAPTDLVAGVRVDGGGELHGANYCLALADLAEHAGATIVEGVRVVGVRESDPCRVSTEDGTTVEADHVVVATHVPILDRGLYFARLQADRSYAIAARTDRALPLGSFYDVASPSRSIRTAAGPEGEDVVVVGGEGHGSGKVSDTAERYARLEAWAREHLGTGEALYRWSSQDPQTSDRAPYVGPLRPGSSRLWTATGFGKWGLSAGTAAAHALCDRIAGRDDEHRELWDPSRLGQLKPRGAARLALWNAETPAFLIGDRLRPASRKGTDGLAPGEGRIVRHGGRRTAAFRDDEGVVHAHSPLCTHLGCEVHFNDAEQSWDCPCHGSRFDARDGSVLEGPAVRALAPRDAD
ncbi:FAD-dependent oxidoreductase [Patulibacter sp.]|uniref:FAD-dependent oxidoreductase n=1 Tax=Patulibacter sp. TaxID=1912859 RepID=UPI0027181236|nr:FAD-dependent oxidoreductase [Patulibacter sp.]MDO9408546.1 FAD-dependent oxidoreductase [Patulibacter sp.]